MFSAIKKYRKQLGLFNSLISYSDIKNRAQSTNNGAYNSLAAAIELCVSNSKIESSTSNFV